MANELTTFNSFIASRYTGIPYSTQWMVSIDRIPTSISSNLIDIDTATWSISKTRESLVQGDKEFRNQVQGNIFAQAVSVPGEKINFTKVGVEHDVRGGFMQAPIVNSRADNEPITIDFLETRDSFTDLVIRPWIIQVGFNGLIPPRNNSDTIKTTLRVIQFDRGDATKSTQAPKARKEWRFFNAVPVSVDPDTFDYQKNQITILKTQWLYTHYTVTAANDNYAAFVPPANTALNLTNPSRFSGVV